MNPDIQLRHDVFAQLNWDPAVNACDVDVQVKNGVATLRGEVADEAQREAAERAARRTDGLATLLNRLIVRPARANESRDLDVQRSFA
ncbi:osmotically-inducible protein OsmY [Variovorax boronicumulans]|uniref:BON domain-containing protein n=1 Tax=Variovorax boronicumulans TaxID=436515 RepID=UPI0024733A3B|nr:BON domain-containing protein [Variovorax boronicumulans]MDH6169142.1 osmotically-inducible protein OsmY [Variovorax boronicumulans]